MHSSHPSRGQYRHPRVQIGIIVFDRRVEIIYAFPLDLRLFTNDVSPTIEDVAKGWRSIVANVWSHDIVQRYYSHKEGRTHSDKLLATASLSKLI
jgi:hypothetical protein